MLLSDILATEQLALRPSAGRPDVATVLAPFSGSGPTNPFDIWDAVSNQALRLCHAHSAGVSIFADARYDELTWVSTAGALAQYRLRRFPQRHSLCGVVFGLKATQLFVAPHRHFQWMEQAGVIADECLIVPLVTTDGMYGTVWVVTHEPAHQFTAADADVLALLGAAATRHIARHHRPGPDDPYAQATGRPARLSTAGDAPDRLA